MTVGSTTVRPATTPEHLGPRSEGPAYAEPQAGRRTVLPRRMTRRRLPATARHIVNRLYSTESAVYFRSIRSRRRPVKISPTIIITTM
jgi:hypothetical protein